MDNLWAMKSEDVGLIVRAISFQDFQPMWSWSTNVTEGQTDRWTDDMRSQDRTLNYSALCGKNHTIMHVKWYKLWSLFQVTTRSIVDYMSVGNPLPDMFFIHGNSETGNQIPGNPRHPGIQQRCDMSSLKRQTHNVRGHEQQHAVVYRTPKVISEDISDKSSWCIHPIPHRVEALCHSCKYMVPTHY